jgi:hypothetical protein
LLSSASLVEASLVIETHFGPDGVRDLDLLLAKAGVSIESVDADQAFEGELRQILTEDAPIPFRADGKSKEPSKSLQGRWSGDSMSLIREDRDR